MKGSIGKLAVDKVLEWMDEMGDKGTELSVKSDQELSIKHFLNEVVEAREEGRGIFEESPLASSDSNGVVERAAQSIEGKKRVMLSAF